jgi:uncharacterized protein YdhG (YjbR/CyaY superfamily)
MQESNAKTVDSYIESFTEDVQDNLKKIRQTIKKAAPKAEEVISYQMPAYKYHGFLVYFAAFKDHYSLFIPPNGVYEAFEDELKPYKIHKATWQIPINESIPFGLIEKVVIFAAKQNEKRKEEKGKY